MDDDASIRSDPLVVDNPFRWMELISTKNRILDGALSDFARLTRGGREHDGIDLVYRIFIAKIANLCDVISHFEEPRPKSCLD